MSGDPDFGSKYIQILQLFILSQKLWVGNAVTGELTEQRPDVFLRISIALVVYIRIFEFIL